ncbi:hypothetical protein PPSIR1_15545 [Plesiocystis pacifica SIR-1]|uniref:Uncharacterized protein n=2 Tax=Plesiocystis pacifica TaxID=191768 RepID=A6GKF9_9BACT|nr:hypothetical protein PPSIR1_15545 [Plesiocystis pacifica SIR-1]
MLASMTRPGEDLDRLLLNTAAQQLEAVRPPIDRADPQRTVSTRSRMLCAGLACLAQACYRGLGGHDADTERALGQAAALLSLLTKIDDQVIDSLAFHGGPLPTAGLSPRALRARGEALDAKTRAYLAPTLASLRHAQVRASDPRDQARCALAARLGQSLRALSRDTPERLDRLLDTIALGWEVQVRAVRLLTLDPARAELPAIEAVTADISGAWLLMITMVGTLPADAARPLAFAEERAFYRWGRAIQTADALADLDKDTADGLVASLPGVHLAALEPALWRRAFANPDALEDRRALYGGLAEAGLDRALTPDREARGAMARELEQLGRVPEWLEWIHAFLSWRWIAKGRALGLRDPGGQPFGAALSQRLGCGPSTLVQRWLESAEASSAVAPTASLEVPCSGR